MRQMIVGIYKTLHGELNNSDIVLRTLINDLRVDIDGLLIIFFCKFSSSLVIGRNSLILDFERFGTFEDLLEKMILAGQPFACIVYG